MSLLLLTLFADSVEELPTLESPEPVAVEVREPAIKAPVIWELDEGTTAVLVEDHRQPLVELRLRFPAGTAHPWFAEAHLEEAWDNLLYDSEGAFRARANDLAVDLSTGSTQRQSRLSLSCLKEDLPAALQLVGELLANRDFDKAELKRTGQGRSIGWKSQQKDPSWVLQQTTASLFYAPGDVRGGAWEKPGRVKKKGLGAEIDVLLALPGRLVGLAGDLTQEEASAALEGLLPALGTAPEGLELPVEELLDDRPEEQVVPLANLTQVYLAVARDGLTWTDPDFASWKVANHVLAGHFYSRLYVALRHEGGETYGVGSWFKPSNLEQHYGLWTFTRAENVEVTVEKLRATLETFRAEGITPEELSQAQGYYRGRRRFDRQSPGGVLDTALWELGNELPTGFDEGVVQAIEALDVDTVKRFAEEFYAADAFTLVKVVPE